MITPMITPHRRARAEVDLGSAHLAITPEPAGATGGAGIEVRAKGDLDLANAERFGEAVLEAAPRGAPVRLVLDEIAFMDSTGVRALLHIAEQLRVQGSALALVCSPGTPARRLLDLLGLDVPFALDGSAPSEA
jgi:anti-anti-sigma factor